MILCGLTAGIPHAAAADVAAANPAAPSAVPTASPTTAPLTPFSDAGDVNGAASSPITAGQDAPELMLFKDMPVVVAAGKREETQQQAPASVSVITASDIELFSYQSLADALRDQRSFYLQNDGLNSFLGVRGLLRPGEYNSSIMVTVDGRPTNELLYGQCHLDEDFVVPMEAIKQVEVIRGPSSSLYGSNADLAVINVVTKDGADLNGGQLRLQGGTDETGRASLLWGSALPGGWDLLAGVTGYMSQGDQDIIYDGVHDAAHDFGHVKGSDAQTVESAFLKVRNGDLTLQADFEDRLVDNSAATYLTSFSNPGTMHEQRGNITLHLDHDLGSGQSIHAMAYYSHYLYSQDYEFAASGSVPAYEYLTTGADDWVGEEVHYDWQVNKSLHLLTGADGRQSLFTRQRDTDALVGTVLNIPASFNNWGLFAEAEYKPFDRLALTAGCRYDQVQRVGSNVSPRFAAVYTPDKLDAIKLLYGRAFRTPNLYELLYASPDANVPNPRLKSEVIDTYEAVWERQFENGWRTSLDGYLWRLSDAMEDYVFPDGAVQTRNGGTVWAHGVEAEVSRKWENRASVRAFVTFTDAQRYGVGLTHSPQWIAGVAAVIPIDGKKTFLSIEPQFIGRQKSDLGVYTDPTFITNVIVTSKDVLVGWDLQVGAYNLFADHARLPRDGAFDQYQPTLDYPHTQYMVTLTHRF